MISDAALLSALAVYALASVSFAVSVGIRRYRRGGPGGDPAADPGGAAAGRIGIALSVLGAALHLIGVVLRSAAAGRPPLGDMFEFAVGSALAAVVVFLLLGRRGGAAADLGLFVLLPVTATLALAVTLLHTEPGPLVPALQSAWLGIHVSVAALAMGVLTVATAATGLRLAGRGGARLDLAAQVAYSVAFPLWTFAVMAGAVWADLAWGRYWGWDPKEVWAFVTWVLLAAHLHARRTSQVRRPTLVTLGLLGYGSLLFNFVAVNIWFDSLHSYAGV